MPVIVPGISSGYFRGAQRPVAQRPGVSRLLSQPSAPALPKIDTLTDDFATADAAKWAFGSGASVTGGQLVLPADTGYTSDTISVARYDLTESAITVELVQRTDSGGGTVETYFSVTGPTGNDLLFFQVIGTALKAWAWSAGGTVKTLINSAAYSATDHRYLRIRHSGGTVFWETSPDGFAWSVLASTTPPFAVTAVLANLGSGYTGTEPSPGTAIFDNVNVAPVPSVTGAGELTATPATLSGAAAVVAPITGTVTLAATPTALAAAGTATTVGTGALATAPATLTGAGTLTVTGTASAAASPASLAGPGVLAAVGSGILTAIPAGAGGEGTLTVTGSGQLAAEPATLTASGTGSLTGAGGLTAAPADLTGSGTLPAAGVGSLSAPEATLDGAGLITQPGTVGGTGGLAAPTPGLNGTGTLTAVGAAELTAQAATVAAAALSTLTGQGTLAAAPAGLTGTGTASAPPAGRRDITITVGPGAHTQSVAGASPRAATTVTTSGRATVQIGARTERITSSAAERARITIGPRE